MNDKLTITLNIAGRPCVLTIEREEEEEIRKAAQLINSKIAKYREKYATADPVDFLAVTAYFSCFFSNHYHSFMF